MESAINEEFFGREEGHLADDFSQDKSEVVEQRVKFDQSTNEETSDNDVSTELLHRVNVKYLGKKPTQGIWGLEFTRKPVDELIGLARARKYTYPAVLEIFYHGVKITYSPKNDGESGAENYLPIHRISYGVQDSVYTHIFSMIVVRDEANARDALFECRCFICESSEAAVDVTRALSKAFKQKQNDDKPADVSNEKEEIAVELEDYCIYDEADEAISEV